jgi:hypothetical protein
MRIEEARFLKEKHLPASLYKYAAFTNTVSKEGAEKLKQNVEGQYWTLVNLKNAVVSLRPPSTFNDPFDSSFIFASKAFLNDLISQEWTQASRRGSHDARRRGIGLFTTA